MAKVLREHEEAASLAWREAKKLQWGELREVPDDWLERTAQKWAQQWVKNMPADFAKKADVMARAIELFDSDLPHQLISQWPEAAREVVADWDAEQTDFDI